jgi:hypothetical protein
MPTKWAHASQGPPIRSPCLSPAVWIRQRWTDSHACTCTSGRWWWWGVRERGSGSVSRNCVCVWCAHNTPGRERPAGSFLMGVFHRMAQCLPGGTPGFHLLPRTPEEGPRHRTLTALHQTWHHTCVSAESERTTPTIRAQGGPVLQRTGLSLDPSSVACEGPGSRGCSALPRGHSRWLAGGLAPCSKENC